MVERARCGLKLALTRADRPPVKRRYATITDLSGYAA